jgi:DNA-3-methyladenine glycosylase II
VGTQYLRGRDRSLARWIDRVGPVGLRRRSQHFGALCRSIISQQLGAAAASTIWGRFLALFSPARWPQPARLLRLRDARLRACGLSQQKLRYLKALAKDFHEGPLRRVRFSRLADAEVIEALTRLPGIGVWTAEMFLIFSLGRPDVFSLGDLALRTAVQRVEGRALEPKEILRAAERWRPYRSVASLYLWKVAHWTEEDGA